tara:strand:+ start:1516 stop:1668 length:153 start_codon:yes stop_codon:yes gene_type:complete
MNLIVIGYLYGMPSLDLIAAIIVKMTSIINNAINIGIPISNKHRIPEITA